MSHFLYFYYYFCNILRYLKKISYLCWDIELKGRKERNIKQIFDKNINKYTLLAHNIKRLKTNSTLERKGKKN